MFRGGWSISSSEAPPRKAPRGQFHGEDVLSRRGMILGGAGLFALALGGCGFRPLHGRGGTGPGDADPALRDILLSTRIGLIAERFGQVMRRSLMQRVGTGIAGPQRGIYELRVGPGVAAEALGIQIDGSATRIRFTATANWTFVRLGPPVVPLFSGQERAIDSFNIPINQFFASDNSREASEQRLADALAEQIVMRLAMQIRERGVGQAVAGAPEMPDAAPGAPAPPSLTEPAGANLLGLPVGSR